MAIDEKKLIEDIDNCVVGLTNIQIMKIAEIIEQQPKVGEWIPCSERFPEKRDWYLALFKEPDSDFVLIPKIADYLMGQRTEFTTEEGWIISNCTDMTEYDNYYKKLKCIAWMPLPEPYKEEVN